MEQLNKMIEHDIINGLCNEDNTILPCEIYESGLEQVVEKALVSGFNNFLSKENDIRSLVINNLKP